MVCKVTELIERLAKERFWGKLTVEMQDGRVILLRKEETIKPAQLNTNLGGNTRERATN